MLFPFVLSLHTSILLLYFNYISIFMLSLSNRGRTATSEAGETQATTTTTTTSLLFQQSKRHDDNKKPYSTSSSSKEGRKEGRWREKVSLPSPNRFIIIAGRS